MNPQDKAKQLFNKYFELVEANSSIQQMENARTAALIAVDEILIALEGNHWQNRMIIDFYSEVNKELDKL